MDERKLLGQRIQRLRKRSGYTQEQLAEIIDINPKYLSSVERGAENPTLDLFLRLAKGLRVELYEIFQFAHEGESPGRLRRKLESLVATVKDEELLRITRVFETLVH